MRINQDDITTKMGEGVAKAKSVVENAAREYHVTENLSNAAATARAYASAGAKQVVEAAEKMPGYNSQVRSNGIKAIAGAGLAVAGFILPGPTLLYLLCGGGYAVKKSIDAVKSIGPEKDL